MMKLAVGVYETPSMITWVTPSSFEIVEKLVESELLPFWGMVKLKS